MQLTLQLYLELLVSLDSSFAVFGICRFDFQSLQCRQTDFLLGAPNLILESNNWLLINRYELDGMRVARDLHDESFINTSGRAPENILAPGSLALELAVTIRMYIVCQAVVN